MRHALELDRDLGDPLRQPLSRPDVERNPRPSPVVDREPDRRVGGRPRIRLHFLLGPISGHRLAPDDAGPVLAPHRPVVDVLFAERPDRLEHLDLLRAHGVRLEGDRRLHRRQTEELEEMILEHVANDARLLVIAGAVLDADGLGDGDLHVVHVAVVPERLEDAVGEAQHEDVLDRLLPEVVVDAVDLPLGKDRRQLRVQPASGIEVVTEGLLHHDPGPAPFRPGEPAVSEELHDRRIGFGRGRQVEDPVAVRRPPALDLLERGFQFLVEVPDRRSLPRCIEWSPGDRPAFPARAA